MKYNAENWREIAQGFTFKPTDQGLTGTRTFMYDGEDYGDTYPFGTPVPPPTPPNLPDIGDTYYPTSSGKPITMRFVCRSIKKEYVKSGDAADARKWTFTCDYSAEPFDNNSFYKVDFQTGSVLQSITSRPINLEFGGDFIVLQPAEAAEANWTFQDGTEVKEAIPYRIITAKLKVTKVITDNDYGGFLNLVLSYLGRINGDLEFPDYPGDTITELPAIGESDDVFENYPGCWLFSEYSATPYFNYSDIKMWKVELTFDFRMPANTSLFSGNTSYGWLRILTNSGDWDIPYYYSATSEDEDDTETDTVCFIYDQTEDLGFSQLLDYVGNSGGINGGGDANFGDETGGGDEEDGN